LERLDDFTVDKRFFVPRAARALTKAAVRLAFVKAVIERVTGRWLLAVLASFPILAS